MATSTPLFKILGPLDVRVGDRSGAPPGDVARRLLAALLLSLSEPATEAWLTDVTWGPKGASRGAVHTAAYRLRAWLVNQVGLPDPLVHGPRGYQLSLPPGAVDSERLKSLIENASAQSEGTKRIGSLEAALALWRGPVLADLPEWTRDHPQVAALEQQRVDALCMLVDARVLAGDPSDATLREIEALAQQAPYDEPVQARVLTMLDLCGRRADALRRYELLRTRLTDELGVDPSSVLQSAYMTLLADQEPEPASQPHTTQITQITPRTLPRDVQDFTGRSAEVRRVLDHASSSSDAGCVVAIDGMAGVGKTTTAIHAAHQLADRYPDGALFLDLHGYTAGRSPLDRVAALRALIRALNVPNDTIPEDPGCVAALWRSLLATRRLIVVLDNAVNTEQVRELLPGQSRCLTLITSRRRLTGLDDVRVVSLSPLTPTAAAELFTSIAGDRAGTDPSLLHEVLDACGHLPLAIRIAATRLQHRPAWCIGDLAERLRDEERRLSELTAADRDVGAAFALSYRELSEESRRAFRLTGMLPGPDLDAWAAAALLDTAPTAASRILDDLVDRHLLQEPVPGRYQFHDLLCQLAQGLMPEEPAGQREQAVRRAIEYYVHAAESSAALLEPLRLRADSAEIPPPLQMHRPQDSDEALGWLIAEFDNINAVAHLAAKAGLTVHAWHLAQSLMSLHRHRGQFSEGVALHEFALTMARERRDKLREGVTHQNLAGVYWTHGGITEALEHCQTSIALYRDIGDRERVGRATSCLGSVHVERGDYQEALRCYRDSLAADRATGDERGAAIELNNIGGVLEKLGEYEAALQHHLQSYEILRSLYDSWAEADVLCSIATALRKLGRYEEAEAHYETAISRSHLTANPTTEAACLGGLGVTLAAVGRRAEAITLCEQGVRMLRDVDANTFLVALLNDLGGIQCDSGEWEGSVATHHEALALARDVGSRYEEARALNGLANALLHCSDRRNACDHWATAARIFTELGVPEGNQVESRPTQRAG